MNKKVVDIVVDMQNDFVTGALGTEEAEIIAPLVAQTASRAIDDGHLIYFTMDTHTPEYPYTREGRALPVKHCIKGTSGWNLIPSVKEVAERIGCKTLVEKSTFGSAALAEIIKRDVSVGEIEKIRIYGVCTGICVMANAVLLRTAFPETDIEVLEDCCACVTPSSHKSAIDTLWTMQFKIKKSEV
jgi:nicotinamidase-related amidase